MSIQDQIDAIQRRIEQLYVEATSGPDKIVRWRVRGVGSDQTPGCAFCFETQPGMYSNLSAFVDSAGEGAVIVNAIGQGAWLDYRESEPQWIQVKVGSCAEHLRYLDILRAQWYVSRECARLLRQKALVPERQKLEKAQHEQ